ncbi:MAG: hypothetical protein SWY16_03750 [Cyanobacteriota bacterium]|nr:hypothetical protein [Cyanobacteriota bacterium]
MKPRTPKAFSGRKVLPPAKPLPKSGSKSWPKPILNLDRAWVRGNNDRHNSESDPQLPPFDLALARAWTQAIRQQEVISLLLVKVEYCPHRKASWKFRTKEQLCQQITRILKGNLYNSEARIFRYAHRRFVCILPGTSASEVKSICHLLPVALRAVGLIPVVGATAVRPTSRDRDPYFLTRTTEAAIYQANQKRSLCCVLNATDPQLLGQTVQTKLSQMPYRDPVWTKLSARALQPEQVHRVAALARECETR